MKVADTRICLTAAAVFLIASSPVYANYLRPVPLEEQFRSSDVVIVAQSVRVTSCNVGKAKLPCVEMADISYLHRRPNIKKTAMIRIITSPGIDELRVECCPPGQRYLIFLNIYKGDYYFYRGRRSLLQLENPDNT
jgi:hypothetical protein